MVGKGLENLVRFQHFPLPHQDHDHPGNLYLGSHPCPGFSMEQLDISREWWKCMQRSPLLSCACFSMVLESSNEVASAMK